MGEAVPTNLADWLEFLRADSHILCRRPELLFQQAANQPDDTAPARGAAARLEAGRERRPWLQWINKPERRAACLQVLTGHEDGVSACAVSPDGRRIASGSADGTVRLWELATGRELATLEGHAGGVSSCAFVRDGGRVVSSSEGTVRVSDAVTGATLAVRERHPGVSPFGLSPDGARAIAVAAQDDTIAELCDPESETPPLRLAGHFRAIRACAFSTDGRHAVTASEDCTLSVWDAATGAQVASLVGHDGPVGACAFLPDGRVVSGSDDSTLKIWDVARAAPVATLTGHTGRVSFLLVSPDGTRVVSRQAPVVHQGMRRATVFVNTETTALKLWDVARGEALGTLDHGGVVYAARVSPDGMRLATGSDDKLVRIWDLRTGELLATLPGHTAAVRDCAFAPDGRVLVSASEDRTLRAWNAAATGGQLESFDGCAFTADGRRIVARARRQLTVLDARSGAPVARISAVHHALSPDGRTLAASSEEGNLVLHAAATGAAVGELPTGAVASFRFSPNGRRLVTAGKTIQLWDADARTRIADLGEGGDDPDVVFSDDSRRVLVQRSRSATSGARNEMYDANTGACLSRRAGSRPGGAQWGGGWSETRSRDLATAGAILHGTTRAVSSDGHRILVASDASVRLANALSGAVLARFPRRKAHLEAWVFAPDARHAASRGSDVVAAWDMECAGAIAHYALQAELKDLAWSPDGSRIAVVAEPGGVHLLELRGAALGPAAVTCWVSPRERRHALPCVACRVWREVDPAPLGTEFRCETCGRLYAVDRFVRLADWQPLAEAWRQ